MIVKFSINCVDDDEVVNNFSETNNCFFHENYLVTYCINSEFWN